MSTLLRIFLPPCLAGLRRLRRLVIVACASVGLAHAGPVPWPEAPFSYFADNARLQTVLAEFAGSFSLTLVADPRLTGTVNGRFTAASPTEFISRLAGVYGFVWYTHAGTLQVSRASDVVVRSVPAPGGRVTGLRQALTELGVLEPRFGWGELPDQGVVMVSGPPSYVALIEATLAALPPAAGAQTVMVFRLRHASAEDRVIRYRDQQITQPGLATVLRELIGNRGGGSGSANSDALSQVAPTRNAAAGGGASSAGGGGSGTAAAAAGSSGAGEGRGGAADRDAGRTGAAGQRAREPSVQSDPRLNALIVQDVPERMPLYARLIEQLDVPTALIEIEAMIIDINTERARELGINWAGRQGRNAAGFGSLSSPAPAGSLALVRGPEGANFSASTLLLDRGNYLISQIRLLETSGDARVQSRPSVLTTDNIGALLDLSETFYVRLQGERVVSVTPVTAGTTLRVTPRLIRQEGEDVVQLTIDIEDGQIQDRQVDTLPTVRRSNVSTQAIVRKDETLLIAGHSADQNIESEQRVPVLGDIPGLGLLFSNRARTVERRERLFLIKPRVLGLPGDPRP